MNPSTPETPAPLSFNSPAIKDALQHYNFLKPLLRASLSNAQIYGLDLADALTHEHEARVKAEAECKALWAEQKVQLAHNRELERKLGALSGMPAHAGELHPSVLLAHRILAVLVENGYIERQIYEECQLIMGAFIVELLTGQPSAGALGEREEP